MESRVKADPCLKRLRVAILGSFEIIGLQECLQQCLSEEADLEPIHVFRTDTVVCRESNSLALFLSTQDFKERVLAGHVILEDLLKEANFQKAFLRTRKRQSLVLQDVILRKRNIPIENKEIVKEVKPVKEAKI